MTKEQRAKYEEAKRNVEEAKILMAKAEEKIGTAAGCFRNLPFEYQLNQIEDELIDLKIDLGRQVAELEKRLNGQGNEEPESWKEAM